MNRYSNSKDINSIVVKLLENGWKTAGKGKHLKIIAPNGLKRVVPGTPSDRRAIYNFRNSIKKATMGIK